MKFPQSRVTWMSMRWNGEIFFITASVLLFHCFFGIVVCQVGEQVRIQSSFNCCAKTDRKKERRMLSLSRVPFPLKKTICAYASGLFCQRNKLLTPCTMEPRLFSSNSQSSPNYFLILKIPNKLSTTCFRVFNMISLVNCNCLSEFLNVHIHSSMVKCWLS